MLPSLFLVLLFAAGVVQAVRDTQRVPAGMEMVFLHADQSESLPPVYLSFSATSTSSSSSSSIPPPPSRLYWPPPGNQFGCHKHPSSSPRVFIVKRGGGCTFAQKLQQATRGGATALVVVNGVEPDMYNATTGMLGDACLLQCGDHSSSSSTISREECERDNGCSQCAETRQSSGKFCCVDDAQLSRMYVGEDGKGIPLYSAALKDLPRLVSAAAVDTVEVTIRARAYSVWDVSLWFLYAYACGVLAVTSYYAVSSSGDATTTRRHVQRDYHREEDAHEEEIWLTAHSSLGFLLSATVSLLVLFALVQYLPWLTVLLIQLVFAIAGSTALVQQLAVCSKSISSPHALLALSLGVACFSFLTRHAQWAWITTNVLGACVVGNFLSHVRVPNLRVACVLLACFFVYDVVMVFVTPLVFAGKSVMVEVATAGRGSEHVSSTTGECVRRVEERLPMLFLCPRGDFWGGFAMLGLGDVVLPGLLVVLARRMDMAKGGRWFYWPWLCAAYAVGLGLALVANVMQWTFNGVAGQPALMYLVPCTLACFASAAWWRGELEEVWHGAQQQQQAQEDGEEEEEEEGV